MKRDISLFIRDIIYNMELADEFIGGLTSKDLAKDHKTVYAVIRCIEIIGEAVKHVPANVKKKYPEIPWKDIAGMRDKAIHFYFGLNLEKVWLVIKNDVPKIKPMIKKVLSDLEK